MTVYPMKNATNLLDGATDAEGDALVIYRIGSTAYPDVGSFPVSVPMSNGTMLVYQTGAMFFDDGDDTSNHPANGVNGVANGSFTFTISDGTNESGTYTFTHSLNGVASVVANRAPIAGDDLFSVVADSTIVGRNVLANDTDQDGDTLTVTEVNGSAGNVGIQQTHSSGALFTVSANGTFDYDPSGVHSGLAAGTQTTDTISYTVSDGTTTDTADIVVTIFSSVAGATLGYGNNPSWDSGRTDASVDLVVDPVSGSDSNSGANTANALRTIQAAVDLSPANGGNVIGLKGGSYTDQANLARFTGAASETLFARMGTEQPVITGAEGLSGWQVLTSGDTTDIGYVGSNWASVYWVDLDKSLFAASDPSGLNLRESGNYMPLAVDTFDRTNLFSRSNPYIMWTANAFNLDGSGRINSITHPAVIGNYTATQLTNSIAKFWVTPNKIKVSTIASANTGTGTVTLTDAGQHTAYAQSSRYAYALYNILPAMNQGDWGYRDLGNGSIRVYCWPTNAASINSSMTYSARTYGWECAGGSRIAIEGLEFREFGGTGFTEGIAFGQVAQGRSTNKNAYRIKQCAFKAMENGGGGYGAVYVSFVDGFVIEDTSFEEINNFGIFVNVAQNLEYTRGYMNKITRSYIRTYGWRDSFMTYFEWDNGATDDHPNTINMYANASAGPCDNVLMHAGKIRSSGGYWADQAASRMYVTFSEFPGSTAANDAHAAKDQNSNGPSGNPHPWVNPTATSRFLNCNFLPDSNELSKKTALTLGIQGVPIRWDVANCIIAGGGVIEPYTKTPPNSPSSEENFSNNFMSALAFWQSSAYGFSLPASCVYEGDFSTMLDAANGDFRVQANSALLTMATENTLSKMNAIAALHPNADLTRDIHGYTIDYNNLKVGPYQDQSYNVGVIQ